MKDQDTQVFWGILVHLSYNMWFDRRPHDSFVRSHPTGEECYAKPVLRFDDHLWNEMVERMVDAGVNAVVFDLGDAVRYESHPVAGGPCGGIAGDAGCAGLFDGIMVSNVAALPGQASGID